jgi:hypothetical protein
LADAGLDHAAHEHFIDALGRDAAPLDRALDGDRAKLGCGERRK